MKSPRDCALESEQHPRLPPGTEERVSGYGVMGQPFGSGQVLGLRRWTASSVGEQFTSIWHRDPDGTWHFYEVRPAAVRLSAACFGHGVKESTVVDIDVAWEAPNVLHVTSPAELVDWTIKHRLLAHDTGDEEHRRPDFSRCPPGGLLRCSRRWVLSLRRRWAWGRSA